MDMRNSIVPPQGEGSLPLNIPKAPVKHNDLISPTTIFAPQHRSRDQVRKGKPDHDALLLDAPEKKLTLFALRLAILEKAATGLGTLAFIWATVILLGGFAGSLESLDFWFVTTILLIEGTRIFSRIHELEWQHQAPRLMSDGDGANHPSCTSVRHDLERQRNHKDLRRNLARKWTTSDVPILPSAWVVSISRSVSRVLHWLQIMSALTCVGLALLRIAKPNDGRTDAGPHKDEKNKESALTVFYILALSEALVFLLEKAYWEWSVRYCKLFKNVNEKCKFNASDSITECSLESSDSIKWFFYESYSRCINGSIFDGLEMDMVTFAMDYTVSNLPQKQLIGVKILHRFTTNQTYSEDTLQKLGRTPTVIEQLVEMLNWKLGKQEECIRAWAAEILSKLAGKTQNSLRVAGIPGAMESISSLLQTSRGSGGGYGIQEGQHTDDRILGLQKFNNLGLLILKRLAGDIDNCGKIGNTRGLLPKIVDLTEGEERILKEEGEDCPHILTVKRSLQVLKLLTSTPGKTGKSLRREISEIVFTVSNIRDILQHGQRHLKLRKLGIEILTNLGMEDDATERIGGTGGVLKELMAIFLNQDDIGESHSDARTTAGEALAMLSLDSERNCQRILRLNAVERLLGALKNPSLCVNAARILQNLCRYSREESSAQLKRINFAAPLVLRSIIHEKNKLQEVMLGLAAAALKFTGSAQESSAMFKDAGITETELVGALVDILENNHYPPTKSPGIRRSVLELAVWMMRENPDSLHNFRAAGMKKELEGILETTSEVENFNVFSGTIGISRHKTAIHSLVETALALLSSAYQ
ncbi:hypothetical protein SAY87_019774 [Trapa incisa]|uniref:ARM repeat superfamily protein n=1 Tax=Trapa incisa TaxID=236973 RepID=A0AAN7JZS3_9MYRT|nr:hypothetical protein SAY87_019774 [Trapa incisa]